MIIKIDGVYHRLTCPECEKDTLVTSGFVKSMAYCSGHCMKDFPVDDCLKTQIIDPEEITALERV